LELLDKTERSKNRRLIAAWNRLHKDLEEHLLRSDRPKEKLQALESKVVNDVESVVIEVTDLEDAFLIFETLNDRGLELSAADLLKSHLLSRLFFTVETVFLKDALRPVLHRALHQAGPRCRRHQPTRLGLGHPAGTEPLDDRRARRQAHPAPGSRRQVLRSLR
jgi:hypothetical protein